MSKEEIGIFIIVYVYWQANEKFPRFQWDSFLKIFISTVKPYFKFINEVTVIITLENKCLFSTV